jgi:hypothetical protein
MIGAIAVLMALIFSKQIYFAAIASYYTFYLIDRFGVSLQAASSISSCSWPRRRRYTSRAVSWATDFGAST